jgi:glycosyltransferase involved in cell wall biosynthesis
LYNSSLIYIILSTREGPNLATTEALLCGCAIISTKSTGGRAIFLNKENSIIVKGNNIDILNGIIEAKKRYQNSLFRPEKIREGTLNQIELMRKKFHFIACDSSKSYISYSAKFWQDGLSQHIAVEIK